MSKLDFLNFEVKAVPEEEGVFEGYASTWERDLIDDEITKGAYAETLSADYPDGGAGIPPLYALAKKLIAQGKTPSVILGFNKKDELFLEKEFKALGIPVTVATADGSLGVKGFVTDAMPEAGYTYLYTCGPEPMLRAIDGKAASSGQFSFEERMGCGFGACMGCTCKTKYGNKRICREGPVLEREEIIW